MSCWEYLRKLKKRWGLSMDDVYDGMVDSAKTPQSMMWALERKRKREEKKCARQTGKNSSESMAEKGK